jgi:hypothetical protein
MTAPHKYLEWKYHRVTVAALTNKTSSLTEWTILHMAQTVSHNSPKKKTLIQSNSQLTWFMILDLKGFKDDITDC